MNITYHTNVPKKDSITSVVPHTILNEEIHKFIRELDLPFQRYYYYFNNAIYFFIYLNNGDRIDVEINS